MTPTTGAPTLKQRRNLTLSPEAVAFLDASPNASATADAAILAAKEAQVQQDSLATLVADLTALIGPPDPDELARARARFA